MAVVERPKALAVLRALLGTEQVRVADVLADPYLPPGLSPDDDPVRLNPDSLIGGYGAEERYVLSDDSDRAVVIAGPASALTASSTPQLTDTGVVDFVTSSLDLTMQGGTTSGVVYPLAICELATSFRFRNVGGASAGAIAAALTAAAELGRSESVRTTETPAVSSATVPGRPTLRRGFTGLTDLIGWLTQVHEPGTRDEFRLAQLFRPGPATRRLFRVAVAAMRGRVWAMPMVVVTAFGRPAAIAALVVVIGTVVLTGAVGAALTDREVWSWAATGWGVLASVVFVASLLALVLVAPSLTRLRRSSLLRRPDPAWLGRLRTVTSTGPTLSARSGLRPPLIGLLLAVLVVVFALRLPSLYLAAVVVGLAGTLVLLAVVLAAGVQTFSHLRSQAFGLLGGTSAQPRRRTPLDAWAAIPPSTVSMSVVPWLDDCLTQLAGLPRGEVLRFGHLWAGAEYSTLRSVSGREPEWRTLASTPDHRLVNLELMTTDLSRQRPYRFPLPPVAPDSPDQLFLAVADLQRTGSEIFPPAVVAALTEGAPIHAFDAEGLTLELYPLPQPWDLPVIFAVRLSMSLPLLFQALRVYTLVERTSVTDDYGRAILDEGRPLTWPEDLQAEELWFSDGGITSNFPVHFFDSPLPRWPTVSLNLGGYPVWAPHQDVWLPQDWDATPVQPTPVQASGASFANAILSTARTWRDSMQSAMPGYRNRIAQVRIRPDEGGTNLFMPAETIASMAVRGAVAGARLRTRFVNVAHWNRFRWLRVRVALSNVERLRATVDQRQGYYADVFTGPAWLEQQKDDFCDAPPGDCAAIPWHEPMPDFWTAGPHLLEEFASTYEPPVDGPDALRAGVPVPEPVLRQTPQE